MAVIDDLLGKVDLHQLYRTLSPEKRAEVERRVVDIGHDRGSCQAYGMDYINLDMRKLRVAACHELGLLD